MTANREYEALTTVEAVQKALNDGRAVECMWFGSDGWRPVTPKDDYDVAYFTCHGVQYRAPAASVGDAGDVSEKRRVALLAYRDACDKIAKLAKAVQARYPVSDARMFGLSADHDDLQEIYRLARAASDLTHPAPASVGDAPSDAVAAPVAWMLPNGHDAMVDRDMTERWRRDYTVPLYTAPPAAPVVSESDALLIERAKDRRDMLLNWRKQMPAVWYGNSTLDGAAKVIDELLLRLSVPATDDKAPAVDADDPVSFRWKVCDNWSGWSADWTQHDLAKRMGYEIEYSYPSDRRAPTSPHDVDAKQEMPDSDRLNCGKHVSHSEIDKNHAQAVRVDEAMVERAMAAMNGVRSWSSAQDYLRKLAIAALTAALRKHGEAK